MWMLVWYFSISIHISLGNVAGLPKQEVFAEQADCKAAVLTIKQIVYREDPDNFVDFAATCIKVSHL